MAALSFRKLLLQETSPMTFLMASGVAGTSTGVFHSEIYLLLLGTVFLFWSLCKPRLPLKKDLILFFIPGLLIGLIPYFAFSSLFSSGAIKAWDKVLGYCYLSAYLRGADGLCDLRKVVLTASV